MKLFVRSSRRARRLVGPCVAHESVASGARIERPGPLRLKGQHCYETRRLLLLQRSLIRLFRVGTICSALLCLPLATGCSDDSACEPDCAEAKPDPQPEACEAHVDCEGGALCTDGVCAPGRIDVIGRLPSGLPEGYSLTDLGEVETVAGETPDLTFEADGTVRDFFVVAIGPETSYVVPLSIVAPDGTAIVVPEREFPDFIVDQYFAGFAGPSTSPNRVTGRPRAVAAMVPNTPSIAMQAGTWTFRIGQVTFGMGAGNQITHEPVEGPLRIAIVARHAELAAQAMLDIVVSVHPSSGLDAAGAQNDPVITKALDNVEGALGPVGVTVRGITYQDTTADIAQPLDLGESCLGGGAPLVFDQVPGTGDALNLVLIGELSCMVGSTDVGKALAGASNGIPGLPFARRDGVLAATALKDMYPEEWALVVAHEAAHHLGLFHTQEGDLQVFDNIPDTDNDESELYLMYSNVSFIDGSLLVSPDQGSVVKRHPLARGK